MNTETAAVISSSTLALAAIIWSGVESWQRRTHESRQADLDNVRDVLDQAAVALHHVAYDLDEVRSYFTTHGPMGFAHSDDGTRIYKALGEHGRELDALYERLSIRLGRDHPAVSQFKAAVEAVLDIARAVGLLRLEDRGDGSPAARHSIHEFEEQTVDRVTQSRATFDTAREQFVAEANRVAGSRLPA